MKNIKKCLLAREFRKNPTKSEYIFWQAIKERKIYGFKFLRQYVASGFILDFYCPKLKLAVEIDGKIHLTKLKYDRDRMDILEKTGIIFFRISASLVENNLDLAVKKLRDFVRSIDNVRVY